MADMSGNTEADLVLVSPGILRVPGEEEPQLMKARKELDFWKNKTRNAEENVAHLTMEKQDEEELKKKAQQEMMNLSKEDKQLKMECSESLMAVQKETEQIDKQLQDLMHKVKKGQDDLKKKKAETARLRQKFKVCTQLPHTNLQFTKMSNKSPEDDRQPITGEFIINQSASAPLREGQALITFEEEKVASQILKMANCSVACDGETLNVKPNRITLDPTVKFELFLQVCRRQLCVLNVPAVLPSETIKDRLEISFSRPSRGGGEVESLEYDKNTGTAHVTFLHPGVAHSLAQKSEYPVFLEAEVKVQVRHVIHQELRKFQTFCGVAGRTVALDGIREVMDPEDLQDHLEIYFQKPNNYGGEIDSFLYAPRGGSHLQAFFSCEKERHT